MSRETSAKARTVQQTSTIRAAVVHAVRSQDGGGYVWTLCNRRGLLGSDWFDAKGAPVGCKRCIKAGGK